MLLLDIPPIMHGWRPGHRVVIRDHPRRPSRFTSGALPRLPLTHHECLTCGKRWTLEMI